MSKINMVLTNIEQIATANAVDNNLFIDVIGNKTDAASNTADVASVIALLRYIIANEDADILAIIGALNAVAKTGAVDDATTVMSYIKQLVTQLLATDIVADTILADTNELQTDWTDGGRLDLILDAIKAVTDVLPDAGALTSIAQGADLTTLTNKVDVIDGLLDVPTEDLATDDTINQVVGKKSDTVAGTSLVALVKKAIADILAAQTDVTTIETSTTTTIPGLIDDVQTEVDKIDVLAGATFDTATDSLEAVRNQLDLLAGSPVASISTDIAGVKSVADAIYASVDTEVAAIKVKTDALPADTSATLGGIETKIDTVDGIVDAIVIDTVAIEGKVDVIDAYHDVPVADVVDNTVVSDVVGNKDDTVTGTSLVALSKQIIVDTTSIESKVDTVDTVVDDIKVVVDAIELDTTSIEDLVDGTTATPVAYRRELGKTQVLEVSVTSAADAGSVTLATITDQPCTIKSIVLASNGATTADLTSAAIEGGAGSVIEFISAATATQAALDAADKQVTFTGVRRIPATGTITIDLQGTGATAVDLTVSIEYFAAIDGGYLV